MENTELLPGRITPPRRFPRWLCCAVWALTITPIPLHAASLAYEGFDYAVGSPLPGLNGPFGWAAPWVGSGQMITVDPTLQYPVALPPTGIKLHNFAVGEAWRQFGPPLDNMAHELWISFMEETTAAGGGAFVSFDPVSPPSPTIIVYKDGAGSVFLSSGGPPIFAGVSAGVGRVDFFVLHVSQFAGSSQVDLFLDPPGPAAPPSASFSVPLPYFIAQFYYRADADQELDEIRAGTTWPDVAGNSHTGDLNCDGVVNFADIDPFVLALSDPAAYQQQYPDCDILNGDINGDGVVNFADIDPFVALLGG